MTWRPLVRGTPDEARARQAISMLAERLAAASISTSGSTATPGSLADGHAGVALFLGRLAVASPEYRHLLDVAASRLDAGATWLVDTSPSPGLFHGFTGVGWTSDHLRRLVDDDDLALNAELDDALLADPPAHFDLVTGLVGAGVYALERMAAPPARQLLGVVIDRLIRAHARDGLATRVDQIGPELAARYPHGYVDLGLAHGIPGVIALLARVAVLDHPSRHPARELMTTLVDEVLRHRMDDRFETCFPARVPPSGPSLPARSAWCYGDAGIALAVMRAATACESKAWRDIALEVARRAAVRPPDDTGNLDGTLCHGGAGYAHVLARLYAATGDELVRAAALDWYTRTLDAQTEKLGFYVATEVGPERADDFLLHGVAGIGLVLTSAISELDPDWDRALLLS